MRNTFPSGVTVQSVWLTRAVGLVLPVLLTLAAATVSAEQRVLREPPAVAEVVAMIEAGVGEAVIVARIQQMAAVPTLTGEEIARLKERGATEAVLLALVGAAAPTAEGPEVAAGAPMAGGRVRSSTIRVILAPSFPVTHYEVLVDGLAVVARGTVFEGQSEPGRILKRPKRFDLNEPVVAYEDTVAPGDHAVRVGFAVSRVDEDSTTNNWMDYSRQRYRTSGVRAIDDRSAERGWSVSEAVSCQVGPGQLCIVTVQFDKRSPSRFGGLPIYAVTYEAVVTSAAEPGEHN
ncbi:MAG: hypothetical protein QGG89_12105 [Vicinamibacterales bacterium]|nr:hypothetical protein [Vicinamibacterales bacterium]